LYVFDVPYSFISFSNTPNNIKSNVPTKLLPTVQYNIGKVVKDSGISASGFTVHQLFLDMAKAEGANYDKQLSKFSGVDEKNTNLFSILMGNYIKTFKLENNAYVLGYSVTAPAVASTTIPKIYPSDVRIYPVYDPNNPNNNSLNYLMVTGKQFSSPVSSIPNSLLNGNDMSFSVSYILFNEQYLSKLVKQISDQLDAQKDKLAFPITQITSTEQGNYS